MINLAMDPLSKRLPTEELKAIELLVGSFAGEEVLYPPEGDPIRFVAHIVGDWEPCERFLRISFYADIPTLGTDTFEGRITYSENRRAYRMWMFAASQEEPMHLVGQFRDGSLIMVSDPTEMHWGMQRLRFNISPSEDGLVIYGERWEPDGYVPYCAANLERMSVHVSR